MTLDVAQFCRDHHFKRKDVTIRIATGNQFAVRIRWERDDDELRSRANCVVLVLANPADGEGLCDSYRRRTNVRSDKAVPAERWHDWEFIHYADGRPVAKPRKTAQMVKMTAKLAARQQAEPAGPAFGL